jgi:hypothetical protein
MAGRDPAINHVGLFRRHSQGGMNDPAHIPRFAAFASASSDS